MSIRRLTLLTLLAATSLVSGGSFARSDTVEQSTAGLAFGPPVHGLALSVKLANDVVTAGAPITVTFAVTNTGAPVKIFRVGSLREYGLVGKGPDGAPIARLNTPILFGGSVPSGVYVDTGQTYEHTTADLSKYYDFHQAGRYKFLFQTSITLELQTSTYAALKSNVVTLDVK